MECTTITIQKQTLELFNMFYHDASYAGELRINILDKVVLGGKRSTLSLVMEKEMGKFDSINNSFYKFYLEFIDIRVEKRINPYTKQLSFKQWSESYEPAINPETLQNIILNGIDKPVFDSFSMEFFNNKIIFVIEGVEQTKSPEMIWNTDTTTDKSALPDYIFKPIEITEIKPEDFV